jgi:glutamate carboxypeptidase
VDGDTTEALRGHCERRLEGMLALLEELVAINSFSGNPEGCARVAEVLARELDAIDGMTVERVESERFGPHLVASSEAARDDPSGCVALVGHLDTVFPPGRFEGFERDGDIVRGPGVLDMKGGLVTAVHALQEVAARGALAGLPLRVVIVSDEEVGSPEGGAVLVERLRGAACALVFEAGRTADAIITARKGTGGVRLVVHGKGAHSGNHHADGVNAIWALAKLIDRAQTFTDYDRGITVNAGTIKGGQSRNTVPDHAEALVDVRYLKRSDGEEVIERMRSAAREVEQAVSGARVEIDGGLARPPLERSEGNRALFREYAACARASGLGDTEAPLIGGGSDASTTAAIGIPSIDGLGPRGSGFHTNDELIEASSLPMKLEALVRFLLGRAGITL